MKKNKVGIIVASCALVAFAIISFLVISKREFVIDNFFYNLLVVNLRNPVLNKIVIGITYIGSAYAYGILVLLFFILFKNKKIPCLMVLNLGISAGLMKVIKHIIQRPRPDGFRLIPETGYSFPSGHSLNAMVFYGLLIYIVHTSVKNKKLRVFLEVLLGLVILLIGLSRIYVGVHYASDVLAGFLFGIVCVTLFINLVYKRVIK